MQNILVVGILILEHNLSSQYGVLESVSIIINRGKSALSDVQLKSTEIFALTSVGTGLQPSLPPGRTSGNHRESAS